MVDTTRAADAYLRLFARGPNKGLYCTMTGLQSLGCYVTRFVSLHGRRRGHGMGG